MEVLGVVTNPLADAARCQKLWPLAPEGEIAYGYDYLIGKRDVATVLVSEPVTKLTSRQNACMKSAVMCALREAGVKFNRATILCAGPTSPTIIEIALQVATASV